MTLSKREQRLVLIIGSLALVSLWVYTAFVITPLMRDASSLRQQVHGAREELAALEAVTANETMQRAQYGQLAQAVLSRQQAMPSEKEIPRSIEFLSDLARQSNVKIQAIFPQRRDEPVDPSAGPPPASLEVLRAVPIQIDALAGYHQLGTFLSLLESSDRPMRLNSLRMSSNPKEPRWHLVKLVLEAYFTTKETAPTDAATPSPS